MKWQEDCRPAIFTVGRAPLIRTAELLRRAAELEVFPSPFDGLGLVFILKRPFPSSFYLIPSCLKKSFWSAFPKKISP